MKNILLFFTITLLLACSNDDDGHQIVNNNFDDYNLLIIERGPLYNNIINKERDTIKTILFDAPLGNDFQPYNNDEYIGVFKPDNPTNYPGGYGGVIRIINNENQVVWEYVLHNEVESLHHDIEVLPNGNILALVWEKISVDDTNSLGFVGATGIYAEKIIEIDYNTKNIVWQWDSKNHLVQNVNSNLSNYGSINNYNKININYSYYNFVTDNVPLISSGDIFHSNGISYDKEKKHIYLSVNFFNEVWVINHDVPNNLTASSEGDLLYRFGNPEAYNYNGTRYFWNQHHPTYIEETNSLTIYGNGNNTQKSTIYEFKLPTSFDDFNGNDTVEVLFEYSNENIHASRLSGVSKLKNGNYLIYENGYGIHEVNNNKEIIWDYQVNNSLWRAYPIYK